MIACKLGVVSPPDICVVTCVQRADGCVWYGAWCAPREPKVTCVVPVAHGEVLQLFIVIYLDTSSGLLLRLMHLVSVSSNRSGL